MSARRARGPVGGTPAQRLELARRVTAASAAVTRCDHALTAVLARLDRGTAAVRYAANHEGDSSITGFSSALEGLANIDRDADDAIAALAKAHNERDAAWTAWVELVGKDQRPGMFGGASIDPWELFPDGSFSAAGLLP